MLIRNYKSADCPFMAELFYETVHTVNAKDYTEEQLNAWAGGKVDLVAWDKSFLEHDTVVADDGGRIVGFGDIDRTGYLDRLYVHKDYQRQGIATAICNRLEQAFPEEKITTHASITARAFFERRGYQVVKEQQVERQGVYLTNYVMERPAVRFLPEQFSRTELLLGEEAMQKLARSRVAVFGIGGVGGYVAEALVRSGIGAIDLIDSDRVCLSNLNRQIIATRSTIGKYKVDAMKERIMDINPACRVAVHRCFYLPENKDDFDFTQYSYIVDAVDTVTAKLQLVMQAEETHTPIISSMGAGNKLDPAGFQVADIYQTSVCPLAKVMRRELKKRGIGRLKVVYSREEPLKAAVSEENTGSRAPGSTAFVPPAVGLIIASEVVKDLISYH